MDSPTPKQLTKNIVPDTQLGVWFTTILNAKQKGATELKKAMRRLDLLAAIFYYGKWSNEYHSVVWDQGFNILAEKMDVESDSIRADADFLETTKILKIIRRGGIAKQPPIVILKITKENHKKYRPSIKKYMDV